LNYDFLTLFYLLAVPASTSWPEFEIEIDFEGTFDSDSCDENNSKSLVMHRHGKPDAMTQSWMDQFEADADNKRWASFQERVSRAPNQVLRYCREPNAKPLWALSSGCPSNADIPSCSSCKGPLCYEFQVGHIYDHSPFFITVIYPISHSLTTATIDVLILFCVYIQYHQIKS